MFHLKISLLCSCCSASVPVLLATFLIQHFLTAFLISGLVKLETGDGTNACEALYFQRTRHLSPADRLFWSYHVRP